MMSNGEASAGSPFSSPERGRRRLMAAMTAAVQLRRKAADDKIEILEREIEYLRQRRGLVLCDEFWFRDPEPLVRGTVH